MNKQDARRDRAQRAVERREIRRSIRVSQGEFERVSDVIRRRSEFIRRVR